MPHICSKSSTLPASARALTCLMMAAVLPLAAGSRVAAQSTESVHRSNALHAVVSSRTSLHVSAEVLQFEIVNPGQAATSSIEFSASARTVAGNEVLLSVETLAPADWAHGDDRSAGALRFAGHGHGTVADDLTAPGPKVAGRWTGSGQRRGSLVFELRASHPGTYRIPVRFVLSAP